MKKILCILCLCVSLAGCAFSELRNAYERGEITAAEYYHLRQQKIEAISRGLQNTAVYMQNERAINQMNQPQTIYLYNMK